MKNLPINHIKITLFLYLFFTLFFIQQKIYASFFETSPLTQNYGDVTNHACAAHWNPAGTHLAIGGVNYPEDVTIYKFDPSYLNPYETISFGSGAYAINWSPNGRYLAVGGNYGYNGLIVYNWNGQTLTLTNSKYHGTQVNAVAWSPNGNTLAVGGNWGGQELALYSWDGSGTLTPKTTKAHGTQVSALAWHPTENKLAVAGNNSSQDLILYNWDGSTLTPINTQDQGDIGTALAWTQTGSWLAAGYSSGGTGYVTIYTLSGSTLIYAASVTFGAQVNTLAWSFDDRYLTVGGDNGSTDVITYEWDGIALTPITDSQTSYGNGAYGAAWSPYANALAIAGYNGSSDVTLYTSHGYLNGTEKKVELSDHYLFTHGGYAIDNVNFANGCTVLPAQKLKLALLTPLSGALDLRDTGILQAEKDVYLDANFTLSSGGVIDAKNHAIYLGNNLIIPDNSIIYIASDTIIDGCGHNLKLGHRSQLFVDSNVTLTLKNLTLENTLNTTYTPPIKLAALNSKLALDNIDIAPSSDFYFTQGQLYIHNDVIFTGTSKFFYRSLCPCHITGNSTLYFDHETTLDYAPTSSNKNLIILQDASSNLYLNGCSVHITHTGLQLTRGNLLLDNKITLSSAHTETGALINSSLLLPQDFGEEVYAVAWSPDGTYLTVGGYNPTDGTNELQTFRFNGSSLTKITNACINFGSYIFAATWSPDGKYLAIGGTGPDEIQIFSFNGSSLTKIDNACYSFGVVNSIAWSPDGNYIAVGGIPTDATNQVQVFCFDGASLVKINNACINYGDTVWAVDWSPDGNYLAIGGSSNPTDGYNEIQIFSFNKYSATKIDTACQSFGDTGAASAFAVAWSPDGTYLAVGGGTGDDDNEIRIFKFNKTTLTPMPQAVYNIGDSIEMRPYIKTIAWNATGNYLAAGCWLPDDDKQLKIFNFNGSALNIIDNACHHFGAGIYSIAWKPDGKYFAIGGSIPDTGAGHEELEVYSVDFSPSFQSETNSLIFGNSELGSEHDLNIKLLSGANVNMHGIVKYDCTN